MLMAESKELKSLLMKEKKESDKVGLKLNIQKTKIMASSPITSWQIDGETVETVSDFFLEDPCLSSGHSLLRICASEGDVCQTPRGLSSLDGTSGPPGVLATSHPGVSQLLGLCTGLLSLCWSQCPWWYHETREM